MKIEEIRYSELYEIYKDLLTPTKAQIAELYFLFDLSLSEIAEIKNCTRQSVLDAIKTVKTELETFESKVGFKSYKEKVDEYFKTLSKEEQIKLKGILER